jgi:hypothetical protein
VAGFAGIRNMFHSHEELVAEALARQEERVAYVDEKLSAEAVGRTEWSCCLKTLRVKCRRRAPRESRQQVRLQLWAGILEG